MGHLRKRGSIGIAVRPIDAPCRRAYAYGVADSTNEQPVPVTARLSKRFYDVLGEDVANELVEWFNAVDLTYRTDLRDLNELNFARFDAKLEQRLAELRAELKQDISGLRADLIRWMFGFWITTLMGLAGLMLALRG